MTFQLGEERWSKRVSHCEVYSLVANRDIEKVEKVEKVTVAVSNKNVK